MGLKLITAPTELPVSLAEMKEHLHYTLDDQDARITSLIHVAREAAETETDRALCPQGWKLTLDGFPSGQTLIRIPKPPLESIDSVLYTDPAGNVQTLDPADYQVDTDSEPGRIAPASGLAWPETHPEALGAVAVIFTAGWQAANQVPAEIKHAMKLLVGHWFVNLEAVTTEDIPRRMTLAVHMLLTHWKEASI